MINTFKNIKSPQVLEEIDVYTFMDMIKNPTKEVLSVIEVAREAYNNGNEDLYVDIKKTLPCFTLNFTFKKWKKDENIKAPSGFIYIDVDMDLEIDLTNKYIFCTWKSLSNFGRGILVKVENLTLFNFKDTYKRITELLGVKSDIQAAKATQFTIHSYDPGLYFNEDAKCFKAVFKEPKLREGIIKTPNTLVKEKERKVTNEMGVIRFDNLHTIDFEGKDYIVFEEKVPFARVYVPRIISKGYRNTIISTITHQLIGINPELPIETFFPLIKAINKDKCKPPLKEEEIVRIVKNKFRQKELPIPNLERRIVFNPDANLSKEKKNKLKGKASGRTKIKDSIAKMSEAIDAWSFEESGKITQITLTQKTGMNIKTIQKHYKHLKERISYLNKQLKNDIIESNIAA